MDIRWLTPLLLGLTATSGAVAFCRAGMVDRSRLDPAVVRSSMRTGLPILPDPRLDLSAPDVGDAAATAALLADPIRAGILRLLADGPHCVCEMAAALGARENNVSNHLAKLREAGIVRASRHEANARFLYYERDEDAVAKARAALVDVLR